MRALTISFYLITPLHRTDSSLDHIYEHVIGMVALIGWKKKRRCAVLNGASPHNYTSNWEMHLDVFSFILISDDIFCGICYAGDNNRK